MPELRVTVEYRSAVREALAGMLKWTFPLWGVVMPIGAVIATLILCGNVIFNNPYSNERSFWQGTWIVAFLYTIPFVSLVISRIAARNTITADRNGLELPPLTVGLGLQKKINWSEIGKASLVGDVAEPWQRKHLVLYSTKGPVPLKLSNFRPEQIEQFLLAIENWGKTTAISDQLKKLPKQFEIDETALIGASYTEMWEDELKRRFCPANFIPLESGQMVRSGSLRVVRPLATGGFSAVYLGQLENQKLVVLKESVVPDGTPAAIQEKARELFDREARMLMRLEHGSIVKVLDHFVEKGRNYMLLEYANGPDLRQHIMQNGPAAPESVTDWLLQVANILKYLHEQNPPIIHRDLTPDNLVLRKDGNIMLIDFGAANEFLGNATGTFVGKQSYISPEQFRGKAVLQSDIYSFGCTAHFLLTGEDPQALSVSKPKEVNPGVPDDLNEIVMMCTQMEPANRYQSAAQLLPVLKRLMAVQI